MLRAVIFDFDGVIADSEMLHFRAFNQVLKPYRVRFTKQQYFREYLGLTDRDLIETLVEAGTLKIDTERIKAVAEEKKRMFEELVRRNADIIDGVVDFLELLKQNGIVIAICSGALLAEIELILDRAKLRDYFEVIVSAEQVANGKPAPDGFLLTLEKLNSQRTQAIKPGECVVVEDSHWGLEAAGAAKMHTVAVTNSYEAKDLAPADRVVDNLSELTIADLNRLCD